MADVIAVVAIPSALSGNHASLFRQVHQATQRRNPFPEDHIKLSNPERRRDFVFCHFYLGANPVLFIPFLQGLNPTDIETNRSVELQCLTASSGFRAAVGDANFLTELVQEYYRAAGFTHVAGNFPQGLAHEPRLQTDVGIPHFTFNFCPRHQCRHRVDHHDVYRRRSDQLIHNLQCGFPGIGLGNQKVININPECRCIGRIKGMFRIDESGNSSLALDFSDRM